MLKNAAKEAAKQTGKKDRKSNPVEGITGRGEGDRISSSPPPRISQASNPFETEVIRRSERFLEPREALIATSTSTKPAARRVAAVVQISKKVSEFSHPPQALVSRDLPCFAPSSSKSPQRSKQLSRSACRKHRQQ